MTPTITSLSLTAPLAGDDFEPNNTQETATPLPLSEDVHTFLFTRNDADWYRVVTTADTHLAVQLNVPETVDYDISLRSSSGLFIASSSTFGEGQDERIVATVPAGTYFVEVRAFNDYSQAQRYSLVAFIGGEGDSFEPNNRRASAHPVGPETLLSKVYTSTDEDWYRFNLFATGSVSIVLEVPPSADLQVALLNGTGGFIASSSNSGLDQDESIVRTLTGPGAYFIVVSYGFQASSSEDYRLTLGGSTIRTPFHVAGDFDGNGGTDLAVYRSATGMWRVRDQFGVQSDVLFGQPGDTPVPGDYDGEDDTSDIAVYRPSTGTWFFLRNHPSSPNSVQFGEPGDLPVPGDYNGDGVTDIAVYRPSTGFWYVRNLLAIQFGAPGDLPVPADYNGDGAVDVAVYRRASNFWFVRNQFAVRFGDRGDLPVPGDYDGDGNADVAVYSPSTGFWHVRNQPSVHLGGAGFRPVPGDYNNDGITDVAVYEMASGVWSVLNQFAARFGDIGDLPVPRPLRTLNRALSDFDGDGTTNVGMYRPSTGQWLVRASRRCSSATPATVRSPPTTTATASSTWRSTGRRPACGSCEISLQCSSAIRPTSRSPPTTTATVWLTSPSTGHRRERGTSATCSRSSSAIPTDVPMPGDYNGDGITDIAVYRPSTGTWYVRNVLAVQFGNPGDVPVAGDYDGDGKTDLAVFRPSTTTWLVRDGVTVSFGSADDTLVPGRLRWRRGD